jgi:CO/xanthine dehydrogenase FAD-binding subunit
VDFPQLALALVADFDGGVVTSLTAVVGALLPKPKTFALNDAVGTTLDDETIERVAQTVFKRVAPQTQLHGDPAWRRHMASIETRRGLMALRDG